MKKIIYSMAAAMVSVGFIGALSILIWLLVMVSIGHCGSLRIVVDGVEVEGRICFEDRTDPSSPPPIPECYESGEDLPDPPAEYSVIVYAESPPENVGLSDAIRILQILCEN